MALTTGACLYLLVLTCLSGRGRTPPLPARTPFFDLIVPAHNEAAGIQRTVANLRQLDWPAGRFRVVVIADNCTDETARMAREAGALVLERHDLSNRGKGYALAHVFPLESRGRPGRRGGCRGCRLRSLGQSAAILRRAPRVGEPRPTGALWCAQRKRVLADSTHGDRSRIDS